MLVKHNLWDAKYHFKDNNIINYQDKFDYVKKDDVIIAKVKEGFPSGLLFILHNSVSKLGMEASIQCFVENLGDIPFNIEQMGLNEVRYIKTIAPHTKEFINYAGVYNGESSQFRVFSNRYEEIKFKIYGLKIIEGEFNDYVYLPNINTLPEDKQPLLPPEGHYKEIQAL